MKLYSYWRSTTSYRVRIALKMKSVAYEVAPIDLAAGAQTSASYLAINPIGGVPSLALPDGRVLTQSMAILEYLERVYPNPPLLPSDPAAAAEARAAAMVVACDIHPVNNLKVGARLKALGWRQDQVVSWMNDWMARGLAAYAALLPADADFSFGPTPTLPDLCLVPQLYNARRWGADLSGLSRLVEIERRCLALPAFAEARPETQPDAPPDAAKDAPHEPT